MRAVCAQLKSHHETIAKLCCIITINPCQAATPTSQWGGNYYCSIKHQKHNLVPNSSKHPQMIKTVEKKVGNWKYCSTLNDS